LEVDALHGEPGVYSARYAGPKKDDDANMDKLLDNLQAVKMEDRTARFAAVLAFVNNTQTKTFKGVVEGRIAFEKKGNAGFGYDPIFIPEGYTESFAQLGEEVKNGMSHRKNAVEKLKLFLEEIL